MIKDEELKELINSGFNVQLISFELDIPIEQVKQYKFELEQEKIIKKFEKRENKSDIHTSPKIQQIRERYMKLYLSDNIQEMIKTEELSKEELEQIQTTISIIEDKIKELSKHIPKDKLETMKSILSEFKKFQNYELPIKEAEKIYSLICCEPLKKLNVSIKGRDDHTKVQRKKSATQLARAINLEHYKIEDIEGLKRLQCKITASMLKDIPIEAGTVRTRILNKITNLIKKQTNDRIRNNISDNIVTIIEDLSNGNIDIENANKIIQAEARKKVENKPKTKFTLTEEQERKQILIQIRTAIAEKADEYCIKDPEKAVLQIQELNNGDLESAIRTVVRNLINRQEYDTAKSLCQKYTVNCNNDTKSDNLKYIKSLKKEIKNSEIGNFVRKAIFMNGTVEQEESYFDLIERGLERGKINLSSISLGKSADGEKDITLADVWNEKAEYEKGR